MDKKDEIRKAAEEIFRNDPFFESFYYDSDVRDVIEHVIREDRKRRDNLESMLIELAGENKTKDRMWRYYAGFLDSAPFNPDIIGEKGWRKSPTEAARAALDELRKTVPSIAELQRKYKLNYAKAKENQDELRKGDT